ncbi:helix-turn-helix transcriptional regulator [Xanthobacter agilis]|uniref:DNA-binding CsgD family transcriptional regulator n=1 Tax=Xanthobacter agilis TaxID=47492 RepID=A0ABU0L9E3_XANAG|nr:helix-turn-helix transcriptional regulator [Xanthobacter agilis]MDQ0503767.1 DNA-binding CsgD family transcriptional regulator [Xanthobacter agilis]
MAEIDLLEVIEQLYGAALQPEQWPQALERMSGAFGAVGTSMVPLGMDTVMRSLVSPDLVDVQADYERLWWRHDTPGQRIVARGMRPGTTGSDRMVMNEEEVRRDPFYREFLWRHGIGEILAALVGGRDGRLVSVAVHRPLARERFQQDEIARMARLSAHIGRAVSITTTLVEARRLSSDLADAVDRLAWGVLLLDGDGAVRHVNAVAERLLGDGLTVSARRARAAHAQDDARLQRAIGAALPGSGGMPARGVLIRRPSGRPALYAEAVPVRPRCEALEVITFGAGGAMLLVRDLGASVPNLTQHLCDLGLTPAEARLADAIGRGGRLREIADAQRISYETARSHLRSIFIKLGIGRQTELVAILSRLEAVTSP